MDISDADVYSDDDDDDDDADMICGECGEWFEVVTNYGWSGLNYCPCCGASLYEE